MATRFGVVSMAFQSKRVRRLVLRVLPVAIALAVLLASLILVSNVQQEASGARQPYVWVLVLTIFALLVVLAAITPRSGLSFGANAPVMGSIR